MFDSQRALAFANTRLDRPGGLADALADRDAAAAWLARDLGYSPSCPLEETEHAELLRVRDSVRRLIRARGAGHAPPPGDLEIVNQTSAAAPRAEQLGAGWQRSARFTATGSTAPGNLTELLGALASATITLTADPPADLAECAADDCVVLFLRTDPRKRWHSDRCGNRMRAARSYARHRPASPRPG
jgi:predicted RNA-binding Zn ribbon-like protein